MFETPRVIMATLLIPSVSVCPLSFSTSALHETKASNVIDRTNVEAMTLLINAMLAMINLKVVLFFAISFKGWDKLLISIIL